MQNLWILCLLFFFSNVSSICHSGDCGVGYCTGNGDECKCYTDYFNSDEPCDTRASQLQKGKYAQSLIEGYEWFYFYVPLSGIHGPIQLDFKVQTYKIFAYYQIQAADNYDLPDDSDDDFCVAISGVPNSCQIAYSHIEEEKNGMLVIGVKNEYYDYNDIQIRYSITTEADSNKISLNYENNLITNRHRLIFWHLSSKYHYRCCRRSWCHLPYRIMCLEKG